MDSGFFEALEVDDTLQKQASHKAIRLANMRVRNSFHEFLAQAPNRQERTARFALIKEDLGQIVADACDETGHEDVDSVRKSVIYSLMSGLDKAAEVDLDQPSMGNPEGGPEGLPPEQMAPGGEPRWEDIYHQMVEQGVPPERAKEMADQSAMRPQHPGGQEPPWMSPDNPELDPRLYSSRRPLDKRQAGPKDLLTYPKRYLDYLQQEPPVGFESMDPNRAGPEATMEHSDAPVQYQVPHDTSGMEQTFIQKGMSPQDAAEEVDEYRHPQRDPRALGPSVDPPYSSTKEARPIQMCPFHKEVMNISLAQGEPRAGYEAMRDHWGGSHHCQGGDYSGPKCNFDSKMTTQQFWDERQERLDQQRQEREQERALHDEVTDRFQEPSNKPENTGLIDDSESVSEDSGSDISESLSEAPSAVEGGDMVMSAYTDDRGAQKPGERAVFKPGEDDAGAAHHDENDQARSIKCPNCNDMIPAGKESCSACGHERGENIEKDSRRQAKDGDTVVKNQDVDRATGPVPEMDKTTWQPTALSDNGGNLHPINTDSGTLHPSEFQDKNQKPDWGGDFLDQTKGVSRQEDATKDTSIGAETMTGWENNGTNPVTQTRDNPLSSFLAAQDLLSDREIQAAIHQYES